jgi:hypothetical protein
MMLQQLKKYTPSYHVEYVHIENCLLFLQETTNLINEQKRSIDNQACLNYLSKSLVLKGIQIENRKLLLFSKMRLKVSIGDDESLQLVSTELWCFLFSNFILFCKEEKKKSDPKKYQSGIFKTKSSNENLKKVGFYEGIFDNLTYYSHFDLFDEKVIVIEIYENEKKKITIFSKNDKINKIFTIEEFIFYQINFNQSQIFEQQCIYFDSWASTFMNILNKN